MAGLRHPVRFLQAVAAVLVVAVGVGSLPPIRAAHASPTITGSGSTFAAIAIDQWRRDIARTQGINVNYSGQGSSQGRRQFIAGTVDWASSDIGFEEGEMPNPPTRGYKYLPLVAGGTALMYNLNDTAGRRISNLQLSGPTIARVFTGQIRNWSDPAIAADNPGLAGRLPNQDIKAVVRQGGSGTSAVFTGYMAAVAPDVWASFAAQYGIPGDFSSTFPDVPGFIKQSGSDGIASFVSNPNAGKGSIGYAEAGYALQAGLPVAYVRNTSGAWTQPTARNVAVALLDARENPDGTQSLGGVYRNPRPESYAISSYNYAIVPTDGNFGFGKDKGDVLRAFVIYCVTEGQSKAAPLGYSPLPPNLVDSALRGLASVPGDLAIPPLGNWGQYYQQLAVEQTRPQEPPPQLQPGGGGGGGDGGAGGGAAGGGGTSGGGVVGGAAGGAGGSTAAGGGASSGGGDGTGSEAAGATTDGTIGGELASGGVTDELAAPVSRLALAEDGSVMLGDSGRTLSVSGDQVGPLLGGGLLLLLIIFVPPFAMNLSRRFRRSPSA